MWPGPRGSGRLDRYGDGSATRRQLIPDAAVEFAAACLRCASAPLLEEERDVVRRALLAKAAKPVGLDGPMAGVKSFEVV